MRGEQVLVPTVEADEGIEKGDGRGGKVHDIVAEGQWLAEDLSRQM